jgi:hypothetical protein
METPGHLLLLIHGEEHNFVEELAELANSKQNVYMKHMH